MMDFMSSNNEILLAILAAFLLLMFADNRRQANAAKATKKAAEKALKEQQDKAREDYHESVKNAENVLEAERGLPADDRVRLILERARQYLASKSDRGSS